MSTLQQYREDLGFQAIEQELKDKLTEIENIVKRANVLYHIEGHQYVVASNGGLTIIPGRAFYTCSGGTCARH